MDMRQLTSTLLKSNNSAEVAEGRRIVEEYGLSGMACQNACFNGGVCTDNGCVCLAYYVGKDCSIDLFALSPENMHSDANRLHISFLFLLYIVNIV